MYLLFNYGSLKTNVVFITFRHNKTIKPNPLTSINDPTTIQEYEKIENLTKRICVFRNETINRYDNLNRKISEINAEGGETNFTYDLVGRMKSLTDPVGDTTSWSYNLLGRVSREEIVINGIRQNRYFYYNGAGNIIRKFDRNGRVTEWTYDGLNRPKYEIWYDTINLWLQKNRQNNSRQHTTIAAN
jgi:YD repeat-containing protein